MTKNNYAAALAVLLFCCPLIYPQEIRLLKQWKHDGDLGGEISHCLLDEHNNIILVHRPGISFVNERQFVNFARWGQGPNEIENVLAICEYRGDLAAFEYKNKLKLFEMSTSGYYEKGKKWLNSNPASFYLRDAFFVCERFFLGGPAIIRNHEGRLNGALLKVYNDKTGQAEGSLIPVQYPEPSRYNEIRRYFAVDGDTLFFVMQNQMTVYQISLADIALTRAIPLKLPGFYVPMPEGFFGFKRYEDGLGLWKDVVKWLTSYSAITRIAVLQRGYLVIQVRTCAADQKKFALLFYNIKNNLSLDKVIYLDGLLLAGEGNILYCIHNGDPMVDEEANQIIIDLYQVVY